MQKLVKLQHDQGFQQDFKQVAKALEYVEKEKPRSKGATFWKYFEIWASQNTFPAFWSKNQSV